MKSVGEEHRSSPTFLNFPFIEQFESARTPSAPSLRGLSAYADWGSVLS